MDLGWSNLFDLFYTVEVCEACRFDQAQLPRNRVGSFTKFISHDGAGMIGHIFFPSRWVQPVLRIESPNLGSN